MKDSLASSIYENFGEREDGTAVNVVQQQDALAARLEAQQTRHLKERRHRLRVPDLTQ